MYSTPSHMDLNIEDTQSISVKKEKSCTQRITFVERQVISSCDYVLDIDDTYDNLLGIVTECNLPLLSVWGRNLSEIIVGRVLDHDE
ncbi:MAG: hypothetical protein WCF97_11595 [Nitrososphaeraceae archaeon]